MLPLRGLGGFYTTMTYLIIYDIQENGIRTKIAKYLEQKGCVRIQKSVFVGNLKTNKMLEIYTWIKDIQDTYPNVDSILFIPIEKDNLLQIQNIGINEALEDFLNGKSMLFF